MRDCCTIYGVELNHAKVVQILRGIIPPEKFEVFEDDSRWEKIVIRGRKCTLTFNSMERCEPGDAFSKLILSTANYVRNRHPGDAEERMALTERLLASNFALGVVAVPGFREDEMHLDCVYSVARGLEGLIFDGIAIIDPEGHERM